MQIMDQVHSQAQSNSMPMAADQSQQLLWQNIQNYARIHSCPSLSSSDPSVFGQIINTTMNQGIHIPCLPIFYKMFFLFLLAMLQ